MTGFDILFYVNKTMIAVDVTMKYTYQAYN